MIRVTINYGDKTRNEKLEGIDYLVCPVVMLTEGVHTGSNGSVLYTADELSKFPEAWNYKPVVVYHPEIDGEGVSACDPTILESHKVGILLNTTWDDKAKKLRSEVWLQKNKVSLVDRRILKAIKNKKVMEVSTGLFSENVDTVGKWGDEEYSMVATAIRADHLALLPDQEGACSVKDGAGLLVTNTHARREAALRSIVQNALSNSTLTQALWRIMSDKLSVPPPDGYSWSGWIVDVIVDNNTFIYWHKSKYWQLSYRANGDKITVSGVPLEVFQCTEYRTVAGFLVGNAEYPSGREKDKEDPMSKKKMKKADLKTKKEKEQYLLENGGWEDGDKPILAKMDEAKLDKFIANVAEENETPADEPDDEEDDTDEEDEEDDDAEEAKTPTKSTVANSKKSKKGNKAKKPVDAVAEFIRNAPPAIAEVLEDSLAMRNREKKRLVNTILASRNNEFTEDELKLKKVSELTKLAKFVTANKSDEDDEEDDDEGAPRTSFFAGGAHTQNRGGDDDEEEDSDDDSDDGDDKKNRRSGGVLTSPTINFKGKEKGMVRRRS